MADKNIEKLKKMLELKNAGRIEVKSTIRTGGREIDLVRFKARFVAKM